MIPSAPGPAQASIPPNGGAVNPADSEDLDADYRSANARSLPAGHCRVTHSGLSSVGIGSEYAEVVNEFGCAGALSSREILGGITFHVFAWNAGQVLALFANRRLLVASRSDK